MSKEALSTPLLRFGVFELDLRAGELRKSGKLIRLAPQPYKLLLLLAAKPGEVVTREDIQREIWGDDTVVDYEQGLSFLVKTVRAALGDDAQSPRYIQTLPRRGYRFIAPVEPAAPHAEAAEGPASSTLTRRRAFWLIGAGLAAIAAGLIAYSQLGSRDRITGEFPPHIQSMAVMPIVNLSNDADQEYFAEGMTDELITELSKIGALRVISRESVMRYKETKKSLPEIAKELNVDAVIEASVLRSASHVRINAQLVDASTQRNLWAASYERDSKDVLSLQRDVAEAIAAKIQVRITPHERQLLQPARTLDPAAYDAYLRGRYLIDRRSTADAPLSTRYFRQAIDLDSGYALAYAGLAESLVSQSLLEAARPDDVMPQARAAARHALQLNPELGEAYSVLGEVERIYELNWSAAEENFKRAIELNPTDPVTEINYAYCLADLGKLREAVSQAQRALELDPVSFYANRTLASMLYFARRYDAALAQFQRTRELHGDPSVIDNWVASIYEKKGMLDEAVRADLSSVGGPAADLDFYRAAYARKGWPGYWRARVERLLPRSNEACAADRLAIVYLHLGDADNAFHWLNRSIDQHCVGALGALVDPQMDAIRSDPRFQELLRRMNFPS